MELQGQGLEIGGFIMNVKFLQESTQVKDNDRNLRTILKEYKLGPWANVDLLLSDKKRGKWFLMDTVKNAYNENCKLLCFSYSVAVYTISNKLASHNYIYLFFLHDNKNKKYSGEIGGRTFGMVIPEDDVKGARLASKFTRDFVKKLSKMSDPYAMLDKIKQTSKLMIGHEW